MRHRLPDELALRFEVRAQPSVKTQVHRLAQKAVRSCPHCNDREMWRQVEDLLGAVRLGDAHHQAKSQRITLESHDPSPFLRVG
jgi:hypothetical protein